MNLIRFRPIQGAAALVLGALAAAAVAAPDEDPFAEIERLEARQRALIERMQGAPGGDGERAGEPHASPTDPVRDAPVVRFRGQVAFGLRGRLYVLDLHGLEIRELPNLPRAAHEPTWSPDGSRLVFGDGKLHIYDLAAQRASHLVDGPRYASFHPAGDTLAYGVVGRGLYIHSIEQDVIQKVLDNSLMPFQPAWHPDGSHLVFVGQPPDDRNRYLYMVATDCVGRRDCNREVRQLVHDGRFNHAPAWSPDGRTIAFSRMSSDDDHWTVTLLDVASGRLTAVTPAGERDHRPVWLDDGAHLVVVRDDRVVSGLKNLHIIDLNGRSVLQLTRDGANAPAYHPGAK